MADKKALISPPFLSPCTQFIFLPHLPEEEFIIKDGLRRFGFY
jgi:hypothetical protein